MRSIAFPFAFCALSLLSVSASAGLLQSDLGLEPANVQELTSDTNAAALPANPILHPSAGDLLSGTSSEFQGSNESNGFALSQILSPVSTPSSSPVNGSAPYSINDGTIHGNPLLHGHHLFTPGGSGDSGTSGTGSGGSSGSSGSPVVATPEPSSIVLIVLGAVGLVLSRRRRR